MGPFQLDLVTRCHLVACHGSRTASGAGWRWPDDATLFLGSFRGVVDGHAPGSACCNGCGRRRGTLAFLTGLIVDSVSLGKQGLRIRVVFSVQHPGVVCSDRWPQVHRRVGHRFALSVFLILVQNSFQSVEQFVFLIFQLDQFIFQALDLLVGLFKSRIFLLFLIFPGQFLPFKLEFKNYTFTIFISLFHIN